MKYRVDLQSNQTFVNELRECAKLLSEKLSADDMNGASQVIGQLIEVRDRNIFNTVGKLTRALHDAIVDFNIDGSLKNPAANSETGDISDATMRLGYVMETTRKAADKTMDMVEASAPIAERLGLEAADLKKQWARLKSREMSADEFRDVYARIDQFFSSMDQGTRELSSNLQDIILEQGFQDITGQIIQRVMSLLKGVEESLVELMRIAGQVEEVTGLAINADDKDNKQQSDQANIKAEGPVLNPESRSDCVSGQDEVDDLLSSLGF